MSELAAGQHRSPDQILPYITRRSFALMHTSLVRFHNLLEEINALSLEEDVRFTSVVTLSIKSLFSLMRQNDSIQTNCLMPRLCEVIGEANV